MSSAANAKQVARSIRLAQQSPFPRPESRHFSRPNIMEDDGNQGAFGVDVTTRGHMVRQSGTVQRFDLTAFVTPLYEHTHTLTYSVCYTHTA